MINWIKKLFKKPSKKADDFVENEENLIRLTCRCGNPIVISDTLVGRKVQCKKCQNFFRIKRHSKGQREKDEKSQTQDIEVGSEPVSSYTVDCREAYDEVYSALELDTTVNSTVDDEIPNNVDETGRESHISVDKNDDLNQLPQWRYFIIIMSNTLFYFLNGEI